MKLLNLYHFLIHTKRQKSEFGRQRTEKEACGSCDCKLHTVGVAQKVNKVMVLPKVGGEIFWDDSEWAVKVRHPTIPSSCCRDSPLALICLSESSYSWHPKDGTLILEMRLTLALLQFCAVLKLEIQKHQIPAFFSRDLSHLRIFLILAPERWNSDTRIMF